MGDPWGVVETNLLLAQRALVRHDTERASSLLSECSKMTVEEAEPRQHYLLTKAWLEAEERNLDRRSSRSRQPRTSSARARAPAITRRTCSRAWSRSSGRVTRLDRIDAWRAVLNDRARRKQG